MPYRVLMEYHKRQNNNEWKDLYLDFPFIEKASSVSEEEIMEVVKPMLEEQGWSYSIKYKSFVKKSAVYGKKNFIYALEKDSNSVIAIDEIYKGKDGKYYHKHSLPLEKINCYLGKAHVFLENENVFRFYKPIRVNLCGSCMFYEPNNAWLWNVEIKHNYDYVEYTVSESIKSELFSYKNLLSVSRTWNLVDVSYDDYKELKERLTETKDKVLKADIQKRYRDAIYNEIYDRAVEMADYVGNCVVTFNPKTGDGVIYRADDDLGWYFCSIPEVAEIVSSIDWLKSTMNSIRVVIPKGNSHIYKRIITHPYGSKGQYDLVLFGSISDTT